MLRVGVSGGGCSGFMYALNFEETEDKKIDETQNLVLDFDGFKVAVDKKSLLFLDGTTIDYLSDINKRGFSFENPNSVKECGCGSSFQA